MTRPQNGVPAEGGGEASAAVTATVLTDGDRARPEPPQAIIRVAKCAKALTFMTCGRLYLQKALLQRLASHLQDMTAALGPCIEKEHAVVRQ